MWRKFGAFVTCVHIRFKFGFKQPNYIKNLMLVVYLTLTHLFNISRFQLLIKHTKTAFINHRLLMVVVLVGCAGFPGFSYLIFVTGALDE